MPFEPIGSSEDDQNQLVARPPRAHPWAAAIDGAAAVPPAVRDQLAFGYNLTMTPEYRAANPPPYLERGGGW